MRSKCNEPDSKPMIYESSRQDLDALLEPRNVVTPLGKYHECRNRERAWFERGLSCSGLCRLGASQAESLNDKSVWSMPQWQRIMNAVRKRGTKVLF